MDKLQETRYLDYRQILDEMARHHYRCWYHMELNLTIVSSTKTYWTPQLIYQRKKILCAALKQHCSGFIMIQICIRLIFLPIFFFFISIHIHTNYVCCSLSAFHVYQTCVCLCVSSVKIVHFPKRKTHVNQIDLD